MTAADAQSINVTYEGTSASTGSQVQLGATYLVTTATVGSNTFTMLFKNGETRNHLHLQKHEHHGDSVLSDRQPSGGSSDPPFQRVKRGSTKTRGLAEQSD